ncbi:unnamed protein product [Durusdinium trenchii]|uniref:Uncharacterized protein n=1 Tax=Durusdinium trenchii TaxID=1381693 RepID=A0ABP0N463_9DINO
MLRLPKEPAVVRLHKWSKRDERRIQQTGFTGVKDSGKARKAPRSVHFRSVAETLWLAKKIQRESASRQDAVWWPVWCRESEMGASLTMKLLQYLMILHLV